MRPIVAFISVFTLLFALAMSNVSVASPEWTSNLPDNFLFLSDQTTLSADVDVFLGQNRRRAGGRVWTNIYYGDTRLRPRDMGRIKPSFYGIQLGFDLDQPNGVHSYFFNLNQSKTRFSGGNSTIDNYLVGYGRTIYFAMIHFAYAGSLGYDQYAISGDDGTSRGSGLQTNLFGEFGLNLPIGRWGIRPFYALQYDFLYQGSIGQRREWNGHGLQQLIGWRLNLRATHALEFQSRVVWVREMLRNPPPFYHMRFSPVHGVNTPAIMFYEGNTGRDWVWLGIGGRLECAYNVYLFLDYDVLLNERHITHLGSLGFLLGW